MLDGLVEGELARHAALPRLIAAVEHGADWSQPAEDALRDSEPVLTALLKAKHLARIEQWSDAERHLMPYYMEPRVQHQLLGIALDEGDATKVVRRAQDLLRRSPDFALRLDIARALIRVGRLDLGMDELRGLAGDVEAPGHLRAVAYQDLTRFALESEHHAQVAELTLGWLELAAGDVTPAWLHAQALFRLGRFGDADTFLVDRQMQAQTVQEAQLVARIYALARPASEALDRIVELADAQSEPDEDLEMMAVTVALQAGGLSDRVNPTRFLELFPDTTLMQAIPAPETEDEIRAFVERLAGGRAEVTREAESGVFEAGNTPAAALAFAAGKEVGEVWGRMNRLPIAYADKPLRDLEVADALGALAVGAVWDPASVFIAGGLAGDTPARIRQALPKSVVAQSVLDDLIAEVPTVQRGEERMELGLDMSGQPATTIWTEDAVRRDERRASGMLAIAREMQVEPDAPRDDDGPEAEFMREHELAGPLRTYGATFAVARRGGLPVFSDDRFVRIRARQSGLPAFGTLALLEAMERRDYITSDELASARRQLRASGALGTEPTTQELVEDARLSGYGLTRGLALALLDPTVLRVRPGDVIHSQLDFLREVFREAPDHFDEWVARVLDALHTLLPMLSLAQHADNLTLLAWQPFEEADTAFLRALIRALRSASSVLGPIGNPVLGATRALAAFIDSESYPRGLKLAVMRTAIDRLPVEDRNRMRLAVFTPSRPRRARGAN